MRLTLSLPPSIPPSASISEWFSSRNTLLRRQLKKSERAKQAVLLDALSAPLRPSVVRPSALRLRRLPLPSSHRCQPTNQRRASSKFPKRASFPPPPPPPSMAVGVKIPRSGLGAAFPSSQPRVGRPRPPGAGFRAPVAVFLSGLGLGCAAARSRLRQRRLPVLRRREEERWRRIVVALAHL